MMRFYFSVLAVLLTFGIHAQVSSLPLVINEIDYDQPGLDASEFIEIKNIADTAVSLQGVELVLINGSSGAPYLSTNLPDITLAGGDYFVVCYGNNDATYCDLSFSSGVQNGAPDGIVLQINDQIIDAVSYEGDIEGIVEGMGVETGDNNNDADISLSRSPDGFDTNNNNADFILACASPGEANKSSRSCEEAADSSFVQIIHNAPSPVVDLYVNGELIADDFSFRSATPFMLFPAGVNLEIAVAPSSSQSAADSLAQFNLTLEDSQDYVIYARGILGDETTPFGLDVFDMARSNAVTSSVVEMLVYHGSPDAPTVDVRLAGTTLLDNIDYANFKGYLPVLPGTYDLQITEGIVINNMLNTIGFYRAGFSDLGGSTVNVFVTGFANIDEPALGVWAATPDGNTFELEQVFLDSAGVQIIHNSPGAIVDIYANGELILSDFEFENATSFINLPVGPAFELAIAPAPSLSAADAIAVLPITFEENRSYTIVANGIVGDDNDPFSLEVNNMAQQSAVLNAEVAVNVFHGSPSSPAVDIAVAGVGNLFDSLVYKDFSSYVNVDPTTYVLEVKAQDTEEVLISFDADLSNLAGQAITIVALGELGNEFDPFRLLAVLADGSTVEIPRTPFARVQIIHNSPTPTVDIYANGELLLDDFTFRTATPFLELPALVDIDIAVAPDTSTSAASAIANFNVNFEQERDYVIIANGIVGDETYPFDLVVNDMVRRRANDAEQVEFLAFHGSPRSPNVDVDVRSIGNVIADLQYATFTDYLSLEPGSYVLDIKATGLANILASYEADLTELAGQSFTLLASGLLNGEPTFAPLAVLSDGTVLELPFVRVANVQIIHNAPMPTVDVYANGELLVDDFAFRTATPFQFLPAGVDVEIAIAPDTSTSAASAIFNQTINLENGREYVVVAFGIVGNSNTPFGLAINEMARSEAEGSDVDLMAFHGSPDAPGVSVIGRNVGTLFDNITFGTFTEYTSLAPDTYYLDLSPAGSSLILATYLADLSEYANQSVVLVASGFLLQSPSFVPLAVLADGTVIELQATSVANVQVIHNSPSPTVDVYANGDLLIDDFTFRTATPFQFLPAGVDIEIAVAPDTSTSAASAIFTQTVNFVNGAEYTVIANGIVGDTNTPFGLSVNENAMSQSNNSAAIEVASFHGSPDGPPVDIDIRNVGSVANNLRFGEFSTYNTLDTGTYFFDFSISGADNIFATFVGDLSSYGGQGITVVASGFISSSPSFLPLAVLPDGTVLELESASVANIQLFHNSPMPTVDIYADGELYVDDFEFRTATPFQTLTAGMDVELAIAPDTSTSVASAIFKDTINLVNGQAYLIIANGIVGDTARPFNLAINEQARTISAANTEVDILVFHGSPDAPTVDIDARNVGNLFSGISYNEYTDYTTVPAGNYYLDLRATGMDAIVATYQADLTALGGQAIAVVASGFLFGTPPFAPFAVLADGTVIELPFAPVGAVQIIHNSPTPTVDIYANDELILDDFEYREATPFTFLPAGGEVKIDIALSNSNSSADAVFTDTLNLRNGENYIAFASGIAGDTDNPLALDLYEGARTEALSGRGVDLLFYHGTVDAPEVDILVFGDPVFGNVEFREFQGYDNIPAASYIFDVTPGDDNSNKLASIRAEIGNLDGGAAVIYATGFLDQADPGFGVWVALPDGTSFPLQLITSTNELERIVASFYLYPNPVRNQAMVNYNLLESADISLQIFNQNGQLIRTNNLGKQIAGAHTAIIDVEGLSGGQYYLSLKSSKGIVTAKMIVIE